MSNGQSKLGMIAKRAIATSNQNRHRKMTSTITHHLEKLSSEERFKQSTIEVEKYDEEEEGVAIENYS